ncbi:MAG: hypothetical protein V1664_01580 [Candidatus Uhrbacteria bacterium]
MIDKMAFSRFAKDTKRGKIFEKNGNLLAGASCRSLNEKKLTLSGRGQLEEPVFQKRVDTFLLKNKWRHFLYWGLSCLNKRVFTVREWGSAAGSVIELANTANRPRSIGA